MRMSLTNYKESVNRFLSLAEEKGEVIFFDLETTGFSPDTERILSCSAIKCAYDGRHFHEIQRANIFMNPGFPIPPAITNITGISDDTVRDCPTEFEAVNDIIAFFGKAPVVAGYNSVSFDERFMDAMYVRTTGRHFTPAINLDVLKMAKEMIHSQKHNLQAVASALSVDKDISFHASMDDVVATKRVFDAILPMYLGEKPLQKPVATTRLRIKGLNYWAPKHTLARIYVQTQPYTKTYLDIYRKEWVSDCKDADIAVLRADALSYAKAETEKELIASVKGKG